MNRTHKVFVFDPVLDPYGARSDPDLFLNNFRPPLVLDEIQCVPELLPALNRRMDANVEPGQYMLSGSQNLALLHAVSESLAGRVGILELGGMTIPELEGRAIGRSGFLEAWIASEGKKTRSEMERAERDFPLDLLWRGTMPALVGAPSSLVACFHDSYVKT